MYFKENGMRIERNLPYTQLHMILHESLNLPELQFLCM